MKNNNNKNIINKKKYNSPRYFVHFLDNYFNLLLKFNLEKT